LALDLEAEGVLGLWWQGRAHLDCQPREDGYFVGVVGHPDCDKLVVFQPARAIHITNGESAADAVDFDVDSAGVDAGAVTFLN